jgi:type III secretory pathway component EscS
MQFAVGLIVLPITLELLGLWLASVLGSFSGSVFG